MNFDLDLIVPLSAVQTACPRRRRRTFDICKLPDSVWWCREDIAKPKTSANRRMHSVRDIVVCWLLNVPAKCECISGTDLLRQFYVLLH